MLVNLLKTFKSLKLKSIQASLQRYLRTSSNLAPGAIYLELLKTKKFKTSALASSKMTVLRCCQKSLTIQISLRQQKVTDKKTYNFLSTFIATKIYHKRVIFSNQGQNPKTFKKTMEKILLETFRKRIKQFYHNL